MIIVTHDFSDLNLRKFKKLDYHYSFKLCERKFVFLVLKTDFHKVLLLRFLLIILKWSYVNIILTIFVTFMAVASHPIANKDILVRSLC